MELTGDLKNQVEKTNSKAEAKEVIGKAGMLLTDDELDNVSGGYMLWGRTCKICGGVINNDPNTPYDIRCHCNEDSTQSWVPRPR